MAGLLDGLPPKVLATLLLKFLAHLDEALVGRKHQSGILSAARLTDARSQLFVLRMLLERLPEANRDALREIVHLIQVLTEHTEYYTLQSLSELFAGIIFKADKKSAKRVSKADLANAVEFISLLVRQKEKMLDSKPVTSDPLVKLSWTEVASRPAEGGYSPGKPPTRTYQSIFERRKLLEQQLANGIRIHRNPTPQKKAAGRGYSGRALNEAFDLASHASKPAAGGQPRRLFVEDNKAHFVKEKTEKGDAADQSFEVAALKRYFKNMPSNSSLPVSTLQDGRSPEKKDKATAVRETHAVLRCHGDAARPLAACG